jgi:hypothetical protein
MRNSRMLAQEQTALRGILRLILPGKNISRQMTMMRKGKTIMTEIERIKNIIKCCQSVGENDIAKIVAYDHIKRIIEEGDQDDLGINPYQE